MLLTTFSKCITPVPSHKAWHLSHLVVFSVGKMRSLTFIIG